MLKIETLRLPTLLPTEDCLKSHHQNKYTYDPEVWEFEYDSRRYLENLSDQELQERYSSILKNMLFIISKERHVIPINTFLSSWYWYRKEHQTRYEFYIRNIEIKNYKKHECIPKEFSTAQIRPKSPNACDVLYRYTKSEYCKKMIEIGEIRLTPASEYTNSEMNEALYDQELEKNTFQSGRYITAKTENGTKIPIIGDIKRTVSSPNYYMFCISCDYDSNLKREFGGDEPAVATIRNPIAFYQRMKTATHDIFKDWLFYYCPIQYFDPYELPKNQRVDPCMSKHFKYAYQKEFRFIWVPQNGELTSGYKTVYLGPLNDIVCIA